MSSLGDESECPRKKPRLSSSSRVEALLCKMTVKEKAGQLQTLVAFDGVDKFLDLAQAGQLGSIFNRAGVDELRKLQKAAVEGSRLGIPILFGADVVHGMRTIFPLPLAEAASFEPSLAELTARAAAIEATAEGLHWTFAPMVDLARDQRWGRVSEGAGEDVLLGMEFAAARVRGFQGEGLTRHDTLLACPKHFAGYGAVTAGLDYNSAELSEASLRELHLPPFKAALDAGAITIMSAFNDISGVPATGSHWLQTEVLRKEWHFTGFVVSDYTADQELVAHGFAANDKDAARIAFTAGVDMSMESGIYHAHLPDLVANGQVPIEMLDEGVRRVLSVKEAAGLLDDPYRSLESQKMHNMEELYTEHAALARNAARRSIVLLKNEGNILPLKKSGQRIALIGPFGSGTKHLNGWAVIWGEDSRAVSIASGIRAAMADETLFTTVDGSGPVEPLPNGIEDAVSAAEQADIVVLTIGEPHTYHGEAQSRAHIGIPESQQLLAKAVIDTGTPVIILLQSGRALEITGAVCQAQAIFACWFLGSQTGHAVADVLFGDYNPSGRLPVSFPHMSGQQPFYYNRTRTGRPRLSGEPRDFKTQFREVTHDALYAFGHGLSYTKFEYGKPSLSTSKLGWDETLTVETIISNVGSYVGEEVVQMYVHDRVASRVRPVRELKGFRKLLIKPGCSEKATFTLSRHDLSFYDAAARCVSEPGVFDLWIAPSSATGEAVSFELLSF